MQQQDTWANIKGVEFEENVDRLKIVWPVARSWPFFILFSASLLIWMGMIIGMLTFIFRGGNGFLLTTMLVIWLLIWVWFGRVLWARWQYVAATREILFVTGDHLILRRPVSLLGQTDAYDMAHVSRFYISDQRHCPTFDYGFQRIYFGQSLSSTSGEQLVAALNGRFFPDAFEDD